MPLTFELTVAHGRRAAERVRVEAVDELAARRLLEAQGLLVLGCVSVEVGLANTLRRQLSRGSGRAQGQVILLVEQLRDLLGAGLSVIEALEALTRGSAADDTPAHKRLIAALREGLPLSAALDKEPARYPALLVALVQASEKTSELPEALTRYIEHQRRTDEWRHKIASAMTYPLVLIGVGIAVLGFLLFYVVPRFAKVFDGIQSGAQALPWSAHLMQSWAAILQDHGVAIAVSLLLMILLSCAALTSSKSRAAMTRASLRWQPIARRLQPYYLARWYRGTGLLVRGGVTLPEALEISTALLPAGLRRAAQSVIQYLREGLGPAAAYTKASMATPVAEQLLRASERTGDLGAVLERLAQFHESEVTRSLDKSMRLLEPLLMVFIGGGVGAIVLLMYLPIFELASAIQ